MIKIFGSFNFPPGSNKNKQAEAEQKTEKEKMDPGFGYVGYSRENLSKEYFNKKEQFLHAFTKNSANPLDQFRRLNILREQIQDNTSDKADFDALLEQFAQREEYKLVNMAYDQYTVENLGKVAEGKKPVSVDTINNKELRRLAESYANRMAEEITLTHGSEAGRRYLAAALAFIITATSVNTALANNSSPSTFSGGAQTTITFEHQAKDAVAQFTYDFKNLLEAEGLQKVEGLDGGDGDKLDLVPTPADTVEGYVQKGQREFNFDKKTGNGEMWDYYGTVSSDKTPCKNGPFYTSDSYEENDLRQLGTVFGTGGENYILCYNYGPDKKNPGKYVAHIVKVPATTKVYRPKGGKSDEIYLAKCGNRLVPVKQLKPDDEPTKVNKEDPKPEKKVVKVEIVQTKREQIELYTWRDDNGLWSKSTYRVTDKMSDGTYDTHNEIKCTYTSTRGVIEEMDAKEFPYSGDPNSPYYRKPTSYQRQ